MSLFPAYAGTSNEEITVPPTSSTAKTEWLENSSFNISEQDVPILNTTISERIQDEEHQATRILKEKEKKKSKKGKRKKRNVESVTAAPKLDFRGDEDYYVDKNGCGQYRNVNTLHKPACPKYRHHFYKTLGRIFEQRSDRQIKRYYKSELGREAKLDDDSVCPLDENAFTQATTDLNRKISQNPCDVSYWMDLVILQDRNPYKWSKMFLSEKKIEILQRALFHHLGNESLYRLYVDIINASYPSFEVSKIIDKLISKDPYNYVLWTAQILTTQCTMARCIVPDVLKIYEQCMQKMHKKLQDDKIMLKLFNNCALFLRQAGLNEQFFALIKLALELNVSPDGFCSLQPLEKDQQALVEYEELILQSGLPMNEIWLRIEKLRQSFNFLPCPENSKCSDPQRVVYNEDICYYIYPLVHRENAFYLILIILRLLKIPIISGDSLRNRFQTKVENIGDTDAIEDILAVFLYKFNFVEERYHNLYEVIFEICKEMCVCPSFLNTTIGYEIYSKSIQEILIICAECFEEIDERKRIIFILIWLRFERILLILHNVSNKVDADYKKRLRSKVKNLLKKHQNRNIVNFYTEYALIEYELGEMNNSKAIFEQILNGNDHENINSDLSNVYLSYVMILLKEKQHEKALKVLMSYALGVSLESLEVNATFTEIRKLSALNKLIDRLNSLIEIEKNVTVMELEQYFLPDYLLNLIGMRTWYQYILGKKLEAIAFLETLLKQFINENERHKFLREQVYELLLSLMQCDSSNCIVSNVLFFNKISQALNEFPENLLILQFCSSIHNQPWYKIRGLLLRSDSILSVIFLIAMAKIRFIQSNQALPDAVAHDEKYNENMYKNRILNILKSMDSRTPFKRNALYWRFYMRCLSDSRTPFETTKKCLLTALDDCPWNKAVYMDGAIFVPQELSHLQDLLIEKQLRVYALPEELEILRANDVQI